MAVGGELLSCKGNGNGNGHKGRPYGLLLLLAFGAAMLGIMALHKLRERRIFNLLVQEKNHQLLSLQLLLQKETEYTKEMKRTVEETKAKMYSLRIQKMELDRTLSEMQSTIDSLKDEQKSMESELEDKQKEIKLLRDKDMDSGNENLQMIALTETLKQKKAEIEELKHQLNSARVLSVNSDDPSNPPVNITIMRSMEQKEKAEFSHEEDGGVHESSNSIKGQNGNETKSDFSQGEDNKEWVEYGNEKKGETSLGSNMKGGQLQKQGSGENARRSEGAAGEMRTEYSKYTTTSRIDKEKNHVNATETIDNMDERKKKNSFTGQLGKLKSPHQEGEVQKFQQSHQRGMKLETDETSRISRLPGRFSYLSRTKGKRWRILAGNRFLKKNVNSGIDGAESTSRRFSKEYKDVRSREEGTVSDEGKAERGEAETSPRKHMDPVKANLLKHQNSQEDTEDMKDRKVSVKRSHQVEIKNAISRNRGKSQAREVSDNSGVNGEANNYYTHDAKQQKIEEPTNTKQNMNSRDAKELEKKAELNSADTNEMKEDMEVSDKQEPGIEAANGDLSSEAMSDSEDKEG